MARPSESETVPLEIVEYDPRWPEHFAQEARRLSAALGTIAGSIEHIGSTAVPGLAAKPVIDIQILVADESRSEEAVPHLASLGYAHSEFPIPYFHRPRFWPHTFHVHVRVEGTEGAEATLAFRDRLRADEALRREYEALKRELAKGADADSREGRARYSTAKTEFIQSALRRAEDRGA